jgi:hypothetical protein
MRGVNINWSVLMKTAKSLKSFICPQSVNKNPDMSIKSMTYYVGVCSYGKDKWCFGYSQFVFTITTVEDIEDILRTFWRFQKNIKYQLVNRVEDIEDISRTSLKSPQPLFRTERTNAYKHVLLS